MKTLKNEGAIARAAELEEGQPGLVEDREKTRLVFDVQNDVAAVDPLIGLRVGHCQTVAPGEAHRLPEPFLAALRLRLRHHVG